MLGQEPIECFDQPAKPLSGKRKAARNQHEAEVPVTAAQVDLVDWPEVLIVGGSEGAVLSDSPGHDLAVELLAETDLDHQDHVMFTTPQLLGDGWTQVFVEQ